MKFLLVIFSMMVWIGVVSAEQNTSRSDFWLDYCPRDRSTLASCSSFVMGYRDSLSLAEAYVLAAEEEKPFSDDQLVAVRKNFEFTQRAMIGCVKGEITNGQMVKIWMKFLEGNPKLHHILPSVTLAMSMKEAFPCN